jgi:LmbE family N-acetylglucosaminyl deacetylase
MVEDRLRSRLGIMILVFVILISIVTVGGFKFHLFDSAIQSVNYSNFQDVHASDKILIFVPHPDDESLGTSGIIREALEKNATVLLVFMTDGDAYNPDFLKMFLNQTNQTGFKGNIGELRHLEAVNATRDLGLNDSNVIFLGYPDGGLKNLFEDNWDYDHLFKRSTGSNLFDHSPYNFSYEKNAPYCGANVDNNIEKIMTDFKPNMIFYPDDGDDHPDHWATSAFVRYAAIKTGYNGSTYCYLVHKGFQWPQPALYMPNEELLPPTELLNLDATWMILPLSKADENLKAIAINSHKSQLFVTKNYLESFIRKDEIYSFYPMIEIEKLGNNSPDLLKCLNHRLKM